MSEKLRLGIIGTGRIADRLMQTLEKGTPPDAGRGLLVTAVYNRHGDSAGRFAKAHGISMHTDDLQELFAAVDAVYIASPHETHADYVRRALKAGKHVLCEKPMTLSGREAEELFALAADHGLVLMEAIKTAYCPGFLALVDCALSGQIGEIVDVEAAFTRLTPTNVRELRDLSYGGSFTEMGSYGLLPVFLLLGQDWENVAFFTRNAVNGLDVYSKAIFDFDDRTATVKTGLGAKSEGQLLITGTKGYILAESPWWLTTHFVVRYEDPKQVEEYSFPYEGSGMQYELAVFLAAVNDRVVIRKSAGKVTSDVCEADDQRTGLQEAGDPGTENAAECVAGLYEPISIASARVMEQFLRTSAEARTYARERLETLRENVRIWAHRGCSMVYPENTLAAFKAAADLGAKLTGIELDVQRTADGRLIVIHDETVDRVTMGHGAVKDMTLDELQGLSLKMIDDPSDKFFRIPTMDEVLDLLAPYCRKNGLRINIELKTSVIRYEGIERQVYNLVKAHDLLNFIIWSSFLPDSIRIIKEIDPDAETGMLAGELEDCVTIGDAVYCDAYHPGNGGLQYATPERVSAWRQEGRRIRAYNGEEPFYGDSRSLRGADLRDAVLYGVTDIFTNVPERYVSCGM